MTAAPTTISRDRAAAPGADYHVLRSEAVELTHTMSRTIWTDYNYSDPGVTILEQLCYALTELPYRAAFSVRELLSAPDSEHVHLRRQGLMPPAAILPCNPVTSQDLRRVVIDRVPEVANVWFTPSKGDELRGLSGLYDVEILARSEKEDAARGCGDDRLTERVLRCYRTHRALCEDVRVARVLTPVDTRVHARAQLEDGADPSDTLAAALFALGLYLAPEPRRRSLAQQLEAEAATSSVFAGPLMLRGFIPDGELRALPRKVPVEQLVQVLAGTPGILSIETLSVEISGEHCRLSGDDVMHAPPDGVFSLQCAGRDGQFTIHLYRDYARCEPNAGRVRRKLAQLWSEQRRTYRLRTEYAGHFAAPQADYRDLDTYMSVQDQFPKLYGIGAAGLGPEATAMRKGQAKQLKGYLMPFDQLMADGFSQIAFLRQLFSVEAGGDATYAWQSLRQIVPDAGPLLRPGYDEGMARLTAEADPVQSRRSAVLDLLLSLYGQAVTGPYGGEGAGVTPLEDAVLIRAKQSMLRHIASLSRNRGRGADYRRPRSARNVSGMERLSRIQLALLDTVTAESGEDRPSRDRRSEPLRTEMAGPAAADFGVRLPAEIWPTLERLFKPVPPFDEAGDEDSTYRSPLDGRRVGTPLAEALADPGRYRIGRSDGSPAVYVVVVVDSGGAWWWLGEYGEEESALEAMRRMLRDSRHPGRHRRHDHRDRDHDGESTHARLYVVDWILLRPAMVDDLRDGAHHTFRVTAVASANRPERDGFAWRREAEAILRRNAPAHVALDCLFLDHRAMRRFERLYDRWLDTMTHCHQARQVEASRDLADFLTQAIEGPEPAPGPAPEPPPPPATPSPPEPTWTCSLPAPEPTPTPTPAPTPAPTPTPTPEPVPPPPPPSATPSPTPEPDSHTLWTWLTWFWQAWVQPILRFIFRWRRLSQRRSEPDSALPPPPASAPPPAPTAAPPPPPPPPPPGTAPAPANLLPGRVAAAPAGATGFDCNTPLTQSSAATFVEAGFEYAVRYVPRTFVVTPDDSQGNLTAAEAESILAAGLALMVVQHVAASPWTPSQSLGESYGGYASANAQAIGLPPGMILWLDLEGVASGTPASSITDYCEAWFDEVAAAGYLPGIYIGANCGLSASQIEALPCDYYWQSGSSVPALSQTGYCMVQSISSAYVLGGVAYDFDVVQTDLDGKTPVWLAPQ